MRFLDLFAGIGGFRTGLERAGFEPFGYVEIDKFARKSYEAIYDTAGEWTKEDITKVTDEEWNELKGQVDIIAGGFPCQSFSLAGKRKGFEDTRGTLFFEIARAAKIIQPSVLFLENVKGLVSHDKGKTLDTIVKTLSDMGYRIDFEVLNSKHFGVPQNRERIFIIAVRSDLVENEPWKAGNKGIVAKGKKRIGEHDGIKTFNFDYPEGEEVTTKLKDVLEKEVDEKFYLSKEQTNRLTFNMEKKEKAEDEIKGDTDISHTLMARDYKGLGNQAMTDAKEALPIKEATKRGYALAEEGDSVNVQYPDSKTRRGRVGKQIANTLQAGETNQGVVEPPFRIRKLTPKECWRLQGFTDEQFNKAQEVNSNSQLYKQAGNAVTVNVIEAIAKKIKETYNLN